MPASASCTREVSRAYCFCCASERWCTMRDMKYTDTASSGIGRSAQSVSSGEMMNMTVAAVATVTTARVAYMIAGPM